MCKTTLAVLTALILGVGAVIPLRAAEDESWYGSDPADELALVLQPGLNPAGWTAAPTTAGALFEAIAEAEAIFAWDAARQRWLAAGRDAPAGPDALEEIEPGTGLLIGIGGDEAVEWTRPIVPDRGTVELRAGHNFAAWGGRDDVPLAHAIRGIGGALAAIRTWDADGGEWVLHDLGSAPEGEIDRGDVLWIEMERSAPWLQPTYLRPEIADGSERLERDLDAVLRYFDREYAVQADAAGLTIRLTSLDLPWNAAGAYFGLDDRIVMRPSSYAGDLLAHEYFHALQDDLTGEAMWFEDGRAPLADLSIHFSWLIEGSAEFIEWDFAMGQDLQNRNLRRVVSSWASARRLAASRLTGNMELLPTSVSVWEYDHGAIAFDRVLGEERAGAGAIIEFWRLMSPNYPVPGRPWAAEPDLAGAFAAAFGTGLDEFIEEFNGWLRQVASERGAEADPERTVRGTIRFDGGAPVAGGTVRLFRSYQGGIGKFAYRSAATSAEGEYVLRAPRYGTWFLGAEVAPGCEIAVVDGAGARELERATDYSATSGDIEGLDISVAEELCAERLDGKLVSEDGAVLGGFEVWVGSGPEEYGNLWIRTRTDADGRWTAALPSGTEGHRAHARLCELPNRRWGAVPIFGPDWEFQVPEYACVR